MNVFCDLSLPMHMGRAAKRKLTFRANCPAAPRVTNKKPLSDWHPEGAITITTLVP